ncbi:unnamed protein product [Lepidochelys kempii]
MIQLEHSSILFAGRVEHRTLHTKGFQGVLGYPDWDDLDVRSAAISSGPGPVLNKLELERTPGKRITLLRVKLVKHFMKQSAHCLPEREQDRFEWTVEEPERWHKESLDTHSDVLSFAPRR